MADTKLCECGCGEPVGRSKQNPRRWNRFVHGHNNRGRRHHLWNGGRKRNRAGYILVQAPDHPRADEGGYVMEHIVLAERAIGKPLPDGAVIHHVNGNPGDNRSENLVICEDQGYHNLVEQRTRALRACGRAGWLRCKRCKEYDDPDNMNVPERGMAYHQACQTEYDRQRKLQKAGAA